MPRREAKYMRVAVIENRLKDYILNIFNRHQKSAMELVSFLDWKPQQEQYQGVTISKIDDLDNAQYDIIIIAIKENRYLSRLLTYLHKRRIQNVYIVRLFALDMQEDFLCEEQPMKLDSTRVDRMPQENEKPYLVHLETHVCDHCNLNCKACNNFSPFVKEPSYADTNQFESDLKRLAELFSGIGRFFLLGGEPLLAPELCCDMIRCFRKYFPKNELRVLTNATLVLSMNDEFWNCIRDNDVIIHISLYPPVKEKINEIRERLESKTIKYLVFKEVESFAKHWTIYPFEDEKYNNEKCGSGGCHYLRNGEISKCPDAILVDFMTEGNIELSSLKSNDRVKLTQIDNAWGLIEKIDHSINLCKKCTYKRLNHIKWERVEGEADPSDWLLPHRYEFEIEKFKKEIGILKEKIEEQNCADEINRKRITACEFREKELEKNLNIWRAKCDSINQLYIKLQQDYIRINNSYSNKIGRMITWLPRKVRKILQKYGGGGVLKRLRECGLYRISNMYKTDVLKGLEEYEKIVNRFGSNVVVFSTAWRGTGDYFICGLFLEEYLKINSINNFVFLIPKSGGERKVVDLFQVYESHTIEIDNIAPIRIFNSFLASKIVSINHLHHGSPNPKNLDISVSSSIYTGFALTGHNGLNMVDFYLYCGFKFDNVVNKSKPRFIWDDYCIDEWFQKYNLIKGKTILLSPYSTGLKQYEIPEEFWINLVSELKGKGYSLVTNCVGMEKCIFGTIPLNIPYNQSVPFLEKAGYFIGIRSGLCDIIAGAKCRKLVIHTFRAKWWKDGRSIPYTGLNNMGLCDDAFEFEYNNDEQINKLLEQTINYIK